MKKLLAWISAFFVAFLVLISKFGDDVSHVALDVSKPMVKSAHSAMSSLGVLANKVDAEVAFKKAFSGIDTYQSYIYPVIEGVKPDFFIEIDLIGVSRTRYEWRGDRYVETTTHNSGNMIVRFNGVDVFDAPVPDSEADNPGELMFTRSKDGYDAKIVAWRINEEAGKVAFTTPLKLASGDPVSTLPFGTALISSEENSRLVDALAEGHDFEWAKRMFHSLQLEGGLKTYHFEVVCDCEPMSVTLDSWRASSDHAEEVILEDSSKVSWHLFYWQ